MAARRRWSCLVFLKSHSANGSAPPVLDRFDFVFSECGLTAFRDGQRLGNNETFIRFLGEDRYKTLVNFILHYIADLDIPIKRRAHSFDQHITADLDPEAPLSNFETG